MTMYFRNPDMHDECIPPPTQDGQQLANNIVMLGAGLGAAGLQQEVSSPHGELAVRRPHQSAAGTVFVPAALCLRAKFLRPPDVHRTHPAPG